MNYEEQGVITHIDSGGNTRTYSDYCFLGRILKEYYCYDNMVRHTYHFCELGVSCNSGACQDDKRISVSYSEQSDKQETIITGQAVEDIDNDRGIFERITDAFIVLFG